LANTPKATRHDLRRLLESIVGEAKNIRTVFKVQNDELIKTCSDLIQTDVHYTTEPFDKQVTVTWLAPPDFGKSTMLNYLLMGLCVYSTII